MLCSPPPRALAFRVAHVDSGSLNRHGVVQTAIALGALLYELEEAEETRLERISRIGSLGDGEGAEHGSADASWRDVTADWACAGMLQPKVEA